MKSNYSKLILLVLLLVGLSLRLYLLPREYSGDVNNHIAWGKELLKNGPQGIYEKDFTAYGVMAPTYPPIALYAFAQSQFLFDQSVRLTNVIRTKTSLFPLWINVAYGHPNSNPAYLKLPAVMADLGIALFLYLIVLRQTKSPNLGLVSAAIILLSPAVWFNSSSWGQIDNIPVLFLIISSYFLVLKKPKPATLFFVCALLTKQSSIVFAPFYAIYIYQVYGFKQTLSHILLAVSLGYLISLPFWPSFNLLWPITNYLHILAVGSGSNYIVDHAFNFWYLFFSSSKVADSTGFWFGIPAQIWGYLFVDVIGTLIAWWLWTRPTLQILWKTWILMIMAFFLFSTRMHERYLGPAVILLLLPLGGWSKFRIFFYSFISVFYLGNLWHNWWEPPIGWARTMLETPNVINALIIMIIFSFFTLSLFWLKTTSDKTRP